MAQGNSLPSHLSLAILHFSLSFRNVYLCVWIGIWMRGILYQKQPSPGYRENIQQEEVLVKSLQLLFFYRFVMQSVPLSKSSDYHIKTDIYRFVSFGLLNGIVS